MAKVLVLYYSSYGHMEQMANAAAEGVRAGRRRGGGQAGARTCARGDRPERAFQARPAGAHRDRRRTSELRRHHPRRADPLRPHGLADVELPGTRPAALWAQGQLTGKVGSVMSSTATQHGGQETTLFSGITNLLHFGMIIVGLPYSYQGQMTLDEIVGGSPYGATTIAGGQGQRQPSPERARRRPLPGPAGRRDGREADRRCIRPGGATRSAAAGCERSLSSDSRPLSASGRPQRPTSQPGGSPMARTQSPFPARPLLSPQDHTLIMIDLQSQMAFATKSIDAVTLRNNAALVARGGRRLRGLDHPHDGGGEDLLRPDVRRDQGRLPGRRRDRPHHA